MPVFVAPFGFVLGLGVAAYGLFRPAQEFKEDRHEQWGDPGWPVTPVIAWLPRPLARAVWVAIGLLICAGSILSFV